MKEFPILFEGSVKTVRGVEGKSPYLFEYTDKYSIFDWGEMPDLIEGKGESLVFMGNLFFTLLGMPEKWRDWRLSPTTKERFENSTTLKEIKEHGVAHHCLGQVEGTANKLAVKPVKVIRPNPYQENGELKWDYSAYRQKIESSLVPLEVIFRFGVPQGSSLLKRTGSDAYRKEIGLDFSPNVLDTFEVPIIEYSTKLEPCDRYLSYREAKTIAGLSSEEFQKLHELSSLIALRVKDFFHEMGIALWDGKFEFGFSESSSRKDGERNFQLIDSIGPDELRLLYKGCHLSKENLRYYYDGTPWKKGIQRAQALAKQRGVKDWKKICTDELNLSPNKLDLETKGGIEMMYQSLAKTLGEKFHSQSISVFSDACSLDELVAKEHFQFR